MTVRDLLVPYVDESLDEPALRAVEAMEIFADAHVAALVISALPAPIAAADATMSATAIATVISQVREEGARTAAKLRERARGRIEVQAVESWSHAAVDAAVAAARHVDLTIMAIAPRNRETALRNDILEGVLIESGRAVLALPAAAAPPKTFARVLIAWDATREAVRAVAQAGPFLERAEAVKIVTVDARATPRGLGDAPGAQLATHLARHGCNVDILNLDGQGRPASEAILTAAVDLDADLIIMGAFHHARLQQALFGGVTRTLLETTRAPLFLAH